MSKDCEKKTAFEGPAWVKCFKQLIEKRWKKTTTTTRHCQELFSRHSAGLFFSPLSPLTPSIRRNSAASALSTACQDFPLLPSSSSPASYKSGEGGGGRGGGPCLANNNTSQQAWVCLLHELNIDPKTTETNKIELELDGGIFWSLRFQFLMSTSGVFYSALPWSSLLNNQLGSPVWKQTNTVTEERWWLFSTSARCFLTFYGRKHIIMKKHLFVMFCPLAFPPVQHWQLRVAAVCGN